MFELRRGARATARVTRGNRQLGIGFGFARAGEIDQQRRERVGMRRGRELDLPARCERAVARDDTAHQLTHEPHELPAVVRSKAFALGHQRSHQRLPATLGLPGPGEVVPRDQVGEIGRRQIRQRRFVLALDDPEQVVQPLIALKLRDHVEVVAAEAGVEQQLALGGAEPAEIRLGQQPEQWVAPVPGGKLLGVVLELVEQHRDEIHHGVDTRMALEVSRHVGVVLERVQVAPGQRELAARVVAVVGLVHVPQENDLERAAAHPITARSRFLGRACWV